MKITWSWLKDHLDTTLSPKEISEILALGGAENTLHNKKEWANAFGIAVITEVKQHPNADKLALCSVRFKETDFQVVCGDPSVCPGLKVVFALPGTLIPKTNAVLEESTIRGVKSQGMMCSNDELGINLPSTSDEGICKLPMDTPINVSLASILPEDPLFDLEITPNRGDLFSVRGIARELCALNAGTLKLYAFQTFSLEDHIVTEPNAFFTLKTEACTQFCSCLITDVKNKTSLPFFSQRLLSVGLKPISICVDITNYICHEFGRPLHVFDYEALEGPLVVRLSQQGEIFEGLDDQIYTLPEGLIVIADQKGIVSLAGILGGKKGACTLNTTQVLVESAIFDPIAISQGGQKTHILSEARTRFERGIDPSLVLPGLKLAVDMVKNFCGGNSAHICNIETSRPSVKSFLFNYGRVKKLSGAELSKGSVCERLKAVGCTLYEEDEQTLKVIAPSWRHDLSIEEDGIEEVLRLNGYKDIPSTPFIDENPTEPMNIYQQMMWKGRRSLVCEGFFEVITLSFLSQKKAYSFCEDPEKILQNLSLKNPISQDLSVIRPSILPQLLDIAFYHERQNIPFSPIFEGGPQFFGNYPGEQHDMLSGLIPLNQTEGWIKERALTLFDVKGIVERTLKNCGVKKWEELSSGPSWYHPGKSGEFLIDEQPIARWGQLHPRLEKLFEGKMAFAAFEIYISKLPAINSKISPKPYVLSPLQPVTRDLTFVLESNQTVQTLLVTLKKEGKDTLTSLNVIDFFKDETILGKGKKSIALRCTFQPQEKTFSEKELHDLMDQLIQAAKSIDVTLRGQWP